MINLKMKTLQCSVYKDYTFEQGNCAKTDFFLFYIGAISFHVHNYRHTPFSIKTEVKFDNALIDFIDSTMRNLFQFQLSGYLVKWDDFQIKETRKDTNAFNFLLLSVNKSKNTQVWYLGGRVSHQNTKFL